MAKIATTSLKSTLHDAIPSGNITKYPFLDVLQVLYNIVKPFLILKKNTKFQPSYIIYIRKLEALTFNL